jgi:uncharacterized protein with NAD-binding domain and iron-sulfur cluster
VPPKVIVLGGGVAGMSAAHELVSRGFQVEVYERRSIAGGKARSLPVNGSLDCGPPVLEGAGPPAGARSKWKPWLPGEHGFRFFPRFYQHVVDTMSGIPYGTGSVADNLVDTTRVQVARFDQPSFFLPARFPQGLGDLQTIAHTILGLLSGSVGLTLEETARFGTKLWQIFTSCDERRSTEYEKISWWKFVEADDGSEMYQRFFGHGITRSLVAAKARRASTKTIGNIFSQIVFDILRPGPSADRVLNGPTNDVWIDPWLEHLTRSGVKYQFEAEVKRINCSGGVVRSATIALAGQEVEVEGDYFIGAVPVERMADLISADLLDADPSLANLAVLKGAVEWMNGIQFFLTEDVPIAHGHTIYLDSPWAITSVSQPQFWTDRDLADYGDGKVKGIVSVDISNWNVPGLNGKRARDCSRQEVATEVWAQMKRSLNIGDEVLADEQLHSWFLDPDVEASDDPSRPGLEVNTEPLLVNYVDTWRLRPEAVTRIRNFFLAGDYVRTTTDLATMEAANEAARRAVNGVLNASGSTKEPCQLWRLHEPEVLAPWRAYDRLRFREGLPWDDRLTGVVDLLLSVAEETKSLLPKVGGPIGAPQAFERSGREVAGIAHAAIAGVNGAALRDLQPRRDGAGLPSLEAVDPDDGTARAPAAATPTS